MQLRAITAELGCLSVSRICGIARAAQQLEPDGRPAVDASCPKMLNGMLDQLEWTATALKNHRAAAGTP